MAGAYTIAESDELAAFGVDDEGDVMDTSAGLEADEEVGNMGKLGGMRTSEGGGMKKRWLVWMIVGLLGVVVIGLAGVGVWKLVQRNEAKTGTDEGSGTDVEGNSGVGDGADGSSGNGTDDGNGNGEKQQEVKTYTVEVVKRLPHDKMAFTQGFEFKNGVFYESTGLRGMSSLRKVEIESGKVLQRYDIPDMKLFSEGITLHGDEHIFMLTWQAGKGFVFNQTTFEVLKTWEYEGEGWGLAWDKKKDEVWMSDGTDVLRVLEPEELKEKRRLKVTLNGKSVKNLNELEWICGELWANVWMEWKILRIDPENGKVKAIIDASKLPLKEDVVPGMDVLNGIAFDREEGTIWLTGKKWSTVYQVRITDDSLMLKQC